MPGSRTTNTFEEQLAKQISGLTSLKTDPSTTPEQLAWLFKNIEMPMLMRARQPIDNVAQQGTTQYPPPQPGVPGGGAIPPEVALALAAQGSPTMRPGPGPMPGMMPSPSPAAVSGSIDELRRIAGANV